MNVSGNLTPCATGDCDQGYLHATTAEGRGLCKNMAITISDAGGAALLEIHPCPWTAMSKLAGNHPDRIALREKLGITAIYKGNEYA